MASPICYYNKAHSIPINSFVNKHKTNIQWKHFCHKNVAQALHCTWKFRSELNSKEQQNRSAPSCRGQEQNNIFARCICNSLWSTALSSLLFYAIIIRDFIFSWTVAQNVHFHILHASLTKCNSSNIRALFKFPVQLLYKKSNRYYYAQFKL